jgi:hypothetical protein
MTQESIFAILQEKQSFFTHTIKKTDFKRKQPESSSPSPLPCPALRGLQRKV